MAELSEIQLEQILDAWWDDDQSLVHLEPVRADIAAVRYLSSHHRAPNPDPAFVRELRNQLLAGDVVPHGVTAMPVSFFPNGTQSSVAARVRKTFWPEQRRRMWGLIEFATAAVLILAFLGTAFGGGPFNDLHSLWPQTSERTDDGPTGMYRGNAARTGVMPGPGPVGQPQSKWRKDFGLFGAPVPAVVAGDRIYISQTNPAAVIAIDASTGDTVWTTKVVGGVGGGAPAVGHGLVYVSTAGPGAGGADAGYLVALDAATGNERWRTQSGGGNWTSAALAGDLVYVSSDTGALYAADALTGHERWRFDLETKPSSQKDSLPTIPSPAVAEGVVYAANNGGTVFAVDAQTGHEQWRFRIEGSFVDGSLFETPTFADGSLYFTWANLYANADPTAVTAGIYALNARTGKELWTKPLLGNGLSSLAVVDGVVFIGGTLFATSDVGSTFTALDATTGKTIWIHHISGFSPSVSYADGVLYGTDSEGKIYALDGVTGTVKWQASTGNWGLSSPLVVDGLVIVPSQSGALYAMNGVPYAAISPGAAIDISGLPPCDPPRLSYTVQISGTPAATLFPGDDSPETQAPEIRASEIPKGDPVSAETVASITETLKGIEACARPERRKELYRFYSDDFLRRDWVKSYVQNSIDNLSDWAMYRMSNAPVSKFADARGLPDGRVGVLIGSANPSNLYLIFAEKDGVWLIDEMYDIVSMPDDGGTPTA